MHLKLKDQQLKTILFIYRLLYQTSWQPQTENLQQIHTKKAIQTNAKVSHQITREEKQRGKGRKKIYKNKSKTIKKMAIGKKYRLETKKSIFICSQHVCLRKS